ncbi:inositol monophosphatase [Halobellus salinus]|uniref:fructose-bisphosphatase n=1 Tax=Halobellus salinus TaxID=931585 RepID=A0A830EG51_9EURY|nr:inositol monophosphatase [Halobellus salinus]GGJ06886.1 inositol monophosphatase [Halobellus salinus]SMP15301.1 myo-inositol-1(or 4)-monophosphatase [Halobellus salinus]
MTGDDRVSVAQRAAEVGAEVAADQFRSGIDVERKANKTDVVTAADRDAQAAVIDVLREAYPNDAIVGEEAGALKRVPASGAAWVIDPIDGTNNYVRGTRLWGTAVAAVRDGSPVAGATNMPALGDVYWTDGDRTYRNGESVSVSGRTDPETCAVAPTMWWGFGAREEYERACRAIVERFGDLRRIGCAQAELAGVAEGSLDGIVTNIRPNPWDTLAGVAMVRAAGGTVTDLDGDPWRHDSAGLVASNGRIHDTVLAAGREISAGE